MDIVEFITARYDEDEATAKHPWGLDWIAEGQSGRMYIRDADMGESLILDTCDDGTAEFCAHFQPRRVLAEIKAKRRILTEIVPALIDAEDVVLDENITEDDPADWHDASTKLLRLLAAPYANHSDYDPAWSIEG